MTTTAKTPSPPAPPTNANAENPKAPSRTSASTPTAHLHPRRPSCGAFSSPTRSPISSRSSRARRPPTPRCSRASAAADASPSYRRLFVHGLPPHANGLALEAAFSAFGPVSDCHIVADRTSGHCKGYGFLTFGSRAAAHSAVRSPCIIVAGRPVSAQFASAGPDPFGRVAAGRRVYVTNVAPDASAERLRAFFALFGELDGGSFGFDAETGTWGRSCGYALFLYRAADGARKALEKPYHVFEGRTLHCQLAVNPARKNKAPPRASTSFAAAAAPAAASPALRPVLDAVVAASVGDLAMYAQEPRTGGSIARAEPRSCSCCSERCISIC